MNSSAIIIFLAFVVYSALHSVLASHTLKGWVRGAFGEAAFQRYYRLAFNFIGGLTLLPILWLVAALPDRPLYVILYPWRWLSYAGQLLGAWILWASLQQTSAFDFLGLRQVFAQAGQAADVELVTGGPYARMRHPLYTGSLLVLWLLPMMSLNLFTLNLAIGLYFWIGAYFEERKLSRYFGAAYDEYKASTPMFVPLVRFTHD